MPLLKRFGIQGFKRLRDIDLEMRPLMVMIGANGVGKSSFVDALSLLRATANGSLNQQISDLGGLTSVATRGYSTSISLTAELNFLDGDPLEYRIQLSPQGVSYSISQEILSQRYTNNDRPFVHLLSEQGTSQYYDPTTNGLHSPDWQLNPQESLFFQIPRMNSDAEIIRTILKAATKYHFLDVSLRAPLRLPQQLRTASLPGESGERLSSVSLQSS